MVAVIRSEDKFAALLLIAKLPVQIIRWCARIGDIINVALASY